MIVACSNSPCDAEFDSDYSYDRSFFRRGHGRKYCSSRCRKAVDHRNNGYAYRLKQNHGISIDEFQVMSDDQDGLCAICGRSPFEVGSGPFGVQRLVVDHCHDTGKIRGLLCSPCNVMLGMARDDAEVLYKAVSYLGASDHD